MRTIIVLAMMILTGCATRPPDQTFNPNKQFLYSLDESIHRFTVDLTKKGYFKSEMEDE